MVPAVGRYIGLPFLLIAAILQSTIVPEIRVGDGGPDLLLLLVLSWTMLAGMEESIFWALAGGIFQDLLNGIPTGTSALALVILVFAVDAIVGEVERNNLVFPLVVAGGGTVAYHLLLVVLYTLVGRSVSLGQTLAYGTFPTLIFNVILILPLFRIAGAVFAGSRPHHVTF